MGKTSAVYKIVNTVTGDFYIGSSMDVKQRWSNHKCPSRWELYPNNKMYQDMEKYGTECFNFEILEEVETQYLKQVEQEFIGLLKPTYNNYNAKGWNVERWKASNRKYRQSKKGKETDRKYQQSKKGKETDKKYYSQLCIYNGETLTLAALSTRFSRAGILRPVLEAKKYLVLS